MSVAWDNRAINVPCVRTRSYLDAATPRVSRTPRCNTNSHTSPGVYKPSVVRPITGSIWHTVHGTADGSVITDGTCGEDDEAYIYVHNFARKPVGDDVASAPCIISDTGLILCVADLVTDRCWQAGGSDVDWNPYTIGTEMMQHKGGGICKATLDAAVQLFWWQCRVFGIQPMVPVNDDGEADLDDIPRLISAPGTFRGGWYHANQKARGQRDPGKAFSRAVIASGAEGFNIRSNQDRDVWRKRQAELGMPASQQDGIPGALTVAALRERFGRVTWAVQKNACDEAKSAASGGGGGGGIIIAGALALGALYLMRGGRAA